VDTDTSDHDFPVVHTGAHSGCAHRCPPHTHCAHCAHCRRASKSHFRNAVPSGKGQGSNRGGGLGAPAGALDRDRAPARGEFAARAARRALAPALRALRIFARQLALENAWFRRRSTRALFSTYLHILLVQCHHISVCDRDRYGRP
jgi:hypothetical protein